ncbi:hypothetical protein BGZ73_008100 [Actinomortierella ambigua]|nr:hypothetical protein BGZ73_008100 [Actinomortierella ambigua]
MNPGCQELRLFSTHGTYEYDYSRDSDYGQIVKAIPLERLQHLSMEASAIGPRILDSLAIYHSHSLQTLSLSHARWSLPVEEGSAKIQCLLTTCPNLKHLDISSAIRATRHAVALLGEDAIRTPWVCLGIETLKLTIVRICRPTALRCRLAPDAATAPPSSVLSDKESKMIDDSEENERQHWCQSMQEELFVQLGRLHYLKELRIAPCTTDPSGGLGDNIDCLQWSLKHGLRHMGQCRQLESFVISRIYHGITVPDLQWMCEHWPKLNKASLRSFPQLALQNWIKTNWPR